MIRSVVRQAWRDNPTRVLLAVVAAVAVVPCAWALLVVAIVAWSPA